MCFQTVLLSLIYNSTINFPHNFPSRWMGNSLSLRPHSRPLSPSPRIPSGPLSLSGASGFGVRECMYSARARFLRRNRQVIGSKTERHVSPGAAGSATRKGVVRSFLRCSSSCRCFLYLDLGVSPWPATMNAPRNVKFADPAKKNNANPLSHTPKNTKFHYICLCWCRKFVWLKFMYSFDALVRQ
jgi:hypothetical protein